MTFKCDRILEDGDYYIILRVYMKYKGCFGITKRDFIEIHRMREYEILRHELKSNKELIKLMKTSFIRNRNSNRSKILLRKL